MEVVHPQLLSCPCLIHDSVSLVQGCRSPLVKALVEGVRPVVLKLFTMSTTLEMIWLSKYHQN